ncbi:MAG: serine/threonine-protein kinase [Kofleriaceae bacterium]
MNRVAPSITLGEYELAERIGEGGSGQVYRARGPAGVVAVKLLGPASDLDDAARARFHREIAALGQIDHPNLVKMIAHGIDAELGPYLVLPLLAGTNLRCGRVCPEAAVLLIQPVVQATAALHARGYVHRDLKPENVIAAPDGTITVIDLGLAWREGMTRHTDTGAAVGSVGYMAPEQIEGRAVETSADLWALGVMVYELIAGKRPYARPRPAEEAAAALLGVFPKLTAADRRASEPLAALVARCLALDPAQRPTAEQLATELAVMIDWCDEVTGERAAVVADPASYQARVAPFRVRRAERLAREALDAKAPFVALAHCDRGLAYAPDDASLLALVARAESTTSTPVALTHPAPPVRHPIWPWLAGAAVIVTGVAIAAKLFVSPAPDPWTTSSSTAAPVAPAPLLPDEGDRKMVGNVISVFGRAVDRRDGTATPSSDRELAHDMVGMFGDVLTRGGIDVKLDPHAGQRIPTNAAGWLKRAASEEPADALASVRHALELEPTSYDAQLALCIMLEANHDAAAAITACTTVLAHHPDESYALAARGRAFTETGDHASAKRDLDAACKAGKQSACAASP